MLPSIDIAFAIGWVSVSPSGEVNITSSYSLWLLRWEMHASTGCTFMTIPASPPKG